MIRGKARTVFRQVHLYAGLVFGGLFLLSGLSGSAIVWLGEFDSMLNRDMFHVAPAAGVRSDAPATITPARVQELIDRLTADPHYGRPAQITLPEHADDVLIAWYPRKPSADASMFTLATSRQLMVNPYTLQITDERNWGEVGASRRLLMPTLFHFHRYLVAGEVGRVVVGVSGLVLLITSVFGVLLWWPKSNGQAWRRGITISRGGSWARFNYSAHKAIGIFVAPIFIVLGFSGWYFNLPNWVTPIVSSIATVSPPQKPSNREPTRSTPILPRQAMTVAQAVYPEGRISRIALPATPSAPYRITLRQPQEIRQGDGATRVTIDAYSGKIVRLQDPMRAPGGDTFLNWLYPLHTGAAFGYAGRIFLTLFGVVPLLFAVSGLGIWLKRKDRRHASRYSRPSTPTP
jgi:uncharacterized iron-regulated membrane protein